MRTSLSDRSGPWRCSSERHRHPQPPLPTNPELEHKALACVLIDPTVWPSLSEMSEGAWTSAPARSLWGVFRSLNAAGLPLDDLGTITQRATETGQGQTVNLAYLQGLLTLADMTAYYAPFYAEQLRFLHGRRRSPGTPSS
ncbi:DnaB-like helicase N-terminal domain-containing protein [Deinococcus malanensis]|uniref:DnaB-like helicase N-terminal domain-containing protein n=1 Tax=Deinococcus malanensis TaxID=1706855 RepID=UPI0036381760